MANSPQARKRARQAEKRRKHNASARSMMRTYLKNTAKAIEANDLESAKTAFLSATSAVDKLANKGLITKNKAARHKSRLSKKIKALAA